MTIIISDQMRQPYSDFVKDALFALAEYDIRCLCVCGLAADGECVTGYWDAQAMDKAALASHIFSDAILDAMKANAREILEAAEEDES